LLGVLSCSFAARCVEQALACLEYAPDSRPEAEAIDKLLVPVLCNLAACALKKQAWKKVVQLSEEVLKHRPECVKAWMQCGGGLLGDDEFVEAK
jgi:hypothetical protein